MKKNKKLAVQVSVIVTVAFVIALDRIGTIVVRGTRKMCIESQNGQIERDMDECKGLFTNSGNLIIRWNTVKLYPGSQTHPDGAAVHAHLADGHAGDTKAQGKAVLRMKKRAAEATLRWTGIPLVSASNPDPPTASASSGEKWMPSLTNDLSFNII